jgi:DNA-binding NarL/FixJ family response regulator
MNALVIAPERTSRARLLSAVYAACGSATRVRQGAGMSETLHLIKGASPQLAVIAVTLRDCTGYQLAAMLRNRVNDVYVILVDSEYALLRAECAVAAGAHAYLVESDLCSELPALIARALQ